jgi:hypothetical protein
MCAFPNPFQKREQFSGNMRKARGQMRGKRRRCPGSGCIGASARAQVLGPSNVVSACPRSSPGFCYSRDDLSKPAIARPGSDSPFSGLPIVMGCPWHDIRIVSDAGSHWRNISSELPAPGEQMGEVIQFIPKPAPDRAARLIQEARAIYESIFPTETASIAPIEDDDTSA